MSKEYKVFGGNLDGRLHALVAAKTKKRAAELLNISMYQMTNYFSQTGNEGDIKLAISEPETVFVILYRYQFAKNPKYKKATKQQLRLRG